MRVLRFLDAVIAAVLELKLIASVLELRLLRHVLLF